MLSAIFPSLAVECVPPRGADHAPGKLARENVTSAREKQLLEAAAGGDRRAAEALLRELLPRVRNLVRYFVRGDAEVDDIAQESMLNILRGASSFRGEGNVRSWADRIVARSAFAHLRRARVSQARHVEYTPELAPVSDGESGQSFFARRQAVRALDEVPDEQREVLVMHHVLGLSVKEIADETATPFETVRSRLRLGMARLRSALGEDKEVAQ
ncbi:MAG TPA: RNA polymerase sigma factor [Polyangiales bacterium]|nr:RNA polymerase sigma factor [Polyangiales bacterium]